MKISNKNVCKLKWNSCSYNLYIVFSQLEFKPKSSSYKREAREIMTHFKRAS